jgi:Glucuronosyltransferase GumK, N-terminal domain/Glycosyl transferases group 1
MGSGRKALFVAANYWNSPYRVGSHELANLFVENGWEVGFLSDPVSPFHLLKFDDKLISPRFKIHNAGGERYYDNKLWVYVPFTLLPPQNFPILKSKFTVKNWHHYSFPNVYKKIKENGFDNVDLLYFDNPTQAVWVDIVKHKKSVFRIADNYSGYQKYAGYTKYMEDYLSKKVDLILYTAQALKGCVENLSEKNSMYFPNGVNFKNFSEGSREEPKDLASASHPRIIYAGEMEIRFDFELVKYAADKLPNFSFVLIGNENRAENEFRNFSNVYVFGFKRSSELSKYFYNSDVGIIPFDVEKAGSLINYVNPIKIHQYFACGLPVVSVRWNELESMHTPAMLYNNKEEFIELLKKAVNESFDKEELINEAKKNDWKIRYQQLIDKLGF